MNREKAIPTVLIDNERVVVTEWRFSPGAETGWHRHAYDYVVTPQTTGTLSIETDAGTGDARLESGMPYFRSSGVEHNVINANNFEFVFIEVEIKGG